MLLESLRPETLSTLCERLAAELAEVEAEQAYFARLLEIADDPAQLQTLARRHAARSRKVATLRARLDTLRTARYNDDAGAMWDRTLQVA